MTRTLFVPGALLTTNAERKANRFVRAKRVKEWRLAFEIEARKSGWERLERVRVIAQPYQKKGILADAGGHLPTIKAAIDGLVDAGVLDDDTGRYVPEITCLAPHKNGTEGLKLTLIPAPL